MEIQKQIEIKQQFQAQKLSEQAFININSIENLLKQIQSQYSQFQNIDYLGQDDNNSLILSCFNSKSSQYVALRILRTLGNIWTKVYQEDQVIRIYQLEQDKPNLLSIFNSHIQNNEDKEINLLLFEIKITKKLIQTYSRFYKLTDYLENPHNMKFLSDRDSKMDKNQIQNLKDKFQEYIYLQYVSLSLSNSNLKDVSGQLLANIFSKSDQLFNLELYLAATQISDFVPQQVIDQISLYKSLRYLAISFSQNLLGNESGLLLGNSLSKLQQLYRLELNYNNNYLEDTAAQSIGQGLAQLQNLQYLVIEFQNNKFTVEGVKYLLQSISLMKSLSILTLLIAANRFSYEAGLYLLELIPKCKHLIYLQTEKATKCLTAQGCFNLGFKLCLDVNAQCTYYQQSCAKICVTNSICTSNCCHEGYCISQSTGTCSQNSNNSQKTNTNQSLVIAIVVPIVFGLVIIIGIACFYYQRRKRQLALQALQQTAQKNNNALINNQYKVDATYQNAQIPQIYNNQQMYGQNNLQFQPVVYPNQTIQQTNLMHINQLYYPPQQQFFMAPQQPSQQIPGIYEAQLGTYQVQPQPQMGIPLVKNPLKDEQTNYL